MKKFLLFTLLVTSIFAKLIDGIAATVNNQPITIYEILSTAKNLNISKKQALDLLIQRRLEEEQIKKLGINVNDYEVEQALQNFAAQKGLDVYKLRQIIESKGVPWEVYKKEFKDQLLRKKLYEKISSMNQSRPNEEQLKEYYNNHIDEFKLAKRAVLYKYISPSKEILEKIRQNPLYKPQNPALLVSGTEEVNLEELEPTFAAIINKTPEGGFTPILPLPNDNRFLLIMVQSKKDTITVPFEKAKAFIANKLTKSSETKSIKEYFDKLRSSANIKIYRMP